MKAFSTSIRHTIRESFKLEIHRMPGVGFSKQRITAAKRTSSGEKFFKRNLSKEKSERGLVWRLADGLPYNWREHIEEFLKEDYSEERLGKLKRHGSVYVDGYHSKYLGRHPYRLSTRKQTFFKPHLEASIFQANHQQIFDNYDVNVSRCVVTNGCYHTNKSTLIAQLVPQEESILSGLPSVEAMEIL